jgi:hypothetical protein
MMWSAHATASDAAGSQGGGVSVPGMAHGNLGFRDQASAGRTLVGLAEIDGSGGWVVVREDRAVHPVGFSEACTGPTKPTMTWSP